MERMGGLKAQVSFNFFPLALWGYPSKNRSFGLIIDMPKKGSGNLTIWGLLEKFFLKNEWRDSSLHSQGSMFQYQFKRDIKGQERWSIKAAFVVACHCEENSWEFFQFISRSKNQTKNIDRNKVPLHEKCFLLFFSFFFSVVASQ